MFRLLIWKRVSVFRAFLFLGYRYNELKVWKIFGVWPEKGYNLDADRPGDNVKYLPSPLRCVKRQIEILSVRMLVAVKGPYIGHCIYWKIPIRADTEGISNSRGDEFSLSHSLFQTSWTNLICGPASSHALT